MPRVSLSIGQQIRQDYADAGLSRSEFAELIGIPPSTLTNITAGSWCSRHNAALIAHGLNTVRQRVGLTGDEWTPERVLGQRTDQRRPADTRPPNPRPAPPSKPTRSPRQGESADEDQARGAAA